MGCIGSSHSVVAANASQEDLPGLSYKVSSEKLSDAKLQTDDIPHVKNLNNHKMDSHRDKLINIHSKHDESRAKSSNHRCENHPKSVDVNSTESWFPKWGSQKKCLNVCHCRTGSMMEGSEPKRRSLIRKQNNHQRALQSMTHGCQMALTNLLAMNALDLTAPASDALLKNRKNAWVQVAGHPGSFAPAGPHTIWKKRLTKENNETVAYQALMLDFMRDVIPKFHREVEYNGETVFIEIEDLLQHFTDPSIMDIKMGTRTFLESEVKNPVLRKDLYEKMIKIDPKEPTPEEHKQKAITKLRYMLFREKSSSTSNLGFRIEAMKLSGEVSNANTDLKNVHTEQEVKHLIAIFLRRNKDVQKKLIKRFKEIRRKLESSKFFKTHEIIGSSILILYDKNKHAGAWLIDFAKSLPVEEGTLSHRLPWELGNHEDGYLTGVDNLTRLLSEMNLDDPSSIDSDHKIQNDIVHTATKKDKSHALTNSQSYDQALSNSQSQPTIQSHDHALSNSQSQPTIQSHDHALSNSQSQPIRQSHDQTVDHVCNPHTHKHLNSGISNKIPINLTNHTDSNHLPPDQTEKT